MPYCKNCGHSLPEGTSFCPECGTPVKTAPAPVSGGAPSLETPPKSGGPKIALFAGIAVVLVALIAAAVIFLPRLLSSNNDPDDSSLGSDSSLDSDRRGGVSDTDPSGPDRPTVPPTQLGSYSEQFVTLHQELISGAFSRLSQSSGTSPDRLSTDLTISLDINDPEIRPYLSDSYLTLRIDAGDNALLLDGDLTLMGIPLASAYLTYDDGMVGFCLPEADGVYYTMSLSSLLSLAGEAASGNIDLSSLGGASSRFTMDQLLRMYRTYTDIFLSMANEDNVTCDENGEFPLTRLGGTYTGRVYTCIPTVEDIESVYLALADQLERDQDLRALLGPIDDLEDQLSQAAQELRNDASQIEEELAGSQLAWMLCVGDEATLLMMGNDTAAVALEWYDNRTGGGAAFYMYSDTQDIPLFENRYTRSAGKISGTLTLYSTDGIGDTVRATYTFEENSDASLIPYGSYTLDAGGQTLSLDVERAGGGAVSYAFTVHLNPRVTGTSYDTVVVTVTATPTGTAQAPTGRPTDISGYSAYQLEALFERLGDALTTNLTSALLQAMYGSNYG